MLEPSAQTLFGIVLRQTFQPCEKQSLLSDFHFFVQSAFFRQIAYRLGVGGSQLVTIEKHPTGVRRCDMVDDSDKSGFAGTVGA